LLLIDIFVMSLRFEWKFRGAEYDLKREMDLDPRLIMRPGDSFQRRQVYTRLHSKYPYLTRTRFNRKFYYMRKRRQRIDDDLLS
jgi:hypothetical protein